MEIVGIEYYNYSHSHMVNWIERFQIVKIDNSLHAVVASAANMWLRVL